jgi:hypothetical protein
MVPGSRAPWLVMKAEHERQGGANWRLLDVLCEMPLAEWDWRTSGRLYTTRRVPGCKFSSTSRKRSDTFSGRRLMDDEERGPLTLELALEQDRIQGPDGMLLLRIPATWCHGSAARTDRVAPYDWGGMCRLSSCALFGRSLVGACLEPLARSCLTREGTAIGSGRGSTTTLSGVSAELAGEGRIQVHGGAHERICARGDVGARTGAVVRALSSAPGPSGAEGLGTHLLEGAAGTRREEEHRADRGANRAGQESVATPLHHGLTLGPDGARGHAGSEGADPRGWEDAVRC